MADLITLHENEYISIRDLVYKNFGINLTEQKKSLIIGRLQKEVQQHGFKTFSQYCDYVIGDQSGKALVALVSQITTNHTYFYREKDHFDFFTQTVLPELKQKLISRKTRRLRFWCAGCSSGEEAYTISILLHEFFKHDIRGLDIRLLATDISQRVLEQAKKGIYQNDNVRHLPGMLKKKYFEPLPSGSWRASEDIRSLIQFGCFNLMRKDFPFRYNFQAIFCRNVMIYFDNPTSNALVKRFFDFTDDNGYFFIGHSETLGRGECPYTYIKPAVYRKDKVL